MAELDKPRAPRSSLRNRLLALFLLLVLAVGGGTLFLIERTLAADLLAALETRLASQGRAVATWLAASPDPKQLAPQLGAIAGARITILKDGVIELDSAAAPAEDEHTVAVTAGDGRVIRLSVPLDDIRHARARMRRRLLVGFGFGFAGALFLSWFFVRAITRPIQSVTRTAERFAAGDYDAPPPTEAIQAGGELAVLAHAMTRMAGEVGTRVHELTEQRDLLGVVVGGLVEGVIVVDPDKSIVLANSAARPLLGGDKLPESLARLVQRAQLGEQPDEEIELTGRTVRVSARPLRATRPSKKAHEVGLPETPPALTFRAGVIVVLYDITRMRALESVRREFLSNAAHELRTPVTSISGYAETLLGGSVDAATSKEFLSTIHRNAQRIAGLVSDLLVLDQLEARATAVSDRSPVALAQLVNHASRTAKGVRPDAQIDVDIADQLSVLGTTDGLDHVVQNLIDNALKYGGGTPVVVRATRADQRIRLTVADSGPGIPAGHEQRIFERFHRVDAGRSRDQGGSGLGLAIVKSHVEAMGGAVRVEDAKPGARFVVELDAAPT